MAAIDGDSDAVRFGRLVRECREARGWSQEALAAAAFSNEDRKGYVSQIENGKIPNITRDTVRKIARALDIDPKDIPPSLRPLEATEMTERTNEISREIRADVKRLLEAREGRHIQDQFAALVAELSRQSNLPYEVQRDRAAAKAAVAEQDFEKARTYLDSAARSTRQTAGYALEEYARSLAALGSLAFTVKDFGDARRQFGVAFSLPELSAERVNRYRQSYRIASTAVMARSRSAAAGRKILEEMVNAGVAPEVWTYSTLINLTADYAEGRKILEEMVEAGVAPNDVTYTTMINLAADYAEGRKILEEMVKAGVAPSGWTYATLMKKCKNVECGKTLAGEFKKVHPHVANRELSSAFISLANKFEHALELAIYLRNNDHFVGRKEWDKVYSYSLSHISAKDLLEIFYSQEFYFYTSLESPMNQYRRSNQMDQALILVLIAPYLPAAQKLYRENYQFCKSYFEAELGAGNDEDNLHYAYGIAASLNDDWTPARCHLTIALERCNKDAERRRLHIESLIGNIPQISA